MEDYSFNSSIHKSDASKRTAATTIKANDSDYEESGWTAYFEDLSDNNNIDCSSFSCSSSLISDAATTGAAAWKISHNNSNQVLACSSTCAPSSKTPRKLKFRKTRTKEICEDDSLEDTASSPVNSPKVSELKSNDMNPRKREDQVHNSLGKETASENHYSEIQIGEENKVNFDHGIWKNDCTELKKRGLCLVPLSMFVNYLG
ncbi:hypothetical protein PTKIN_Ptkin02bG0036900 [Pterospermum kingtungense]